MDNYRSLTATVGVGLQLGCNVVINDSVVIGDNCTLGSGVVVYPDTTIGDNVRIDDHCVLGKLPMKAANSAITRDQALAPCVIGNGCLIGTGVIVYRGASIGEHVMLADMSSVREDVEIGEYTIIGRGVSVENKVRIGRRCKIETEAYITALSEIEDFCFVAPEVTFTNDQYVGRTKERFQYHKGVTMRRGARIGANCTVLPGIVLGEDCLVAAGSMVTRDVASHKLVMGTPARVVRDVPHAQLLENQ